jgi:hypothetical protein
MTALHPLARRVNHPAPLRHTAPAWLLIVGLLAAPVAWSLQLLISYGVSGEKCGAYGPLATLPLGSRSMTFAAIGVAAVVACLLGLWAAYVTWRLTREEASGDHHVGLTAGAGRTRFLGLCGIISSATFLVGAAFALLIPFLVSPCAAALS